MAEKSKPRILKVGLVQDGKVIEEIQLKPRQEVNVGQEPENMFVIVESNFPRKHLMLEPYQDTYQLHLLDSMDGKISLDDKIYTIDEIIQKGIAHKKGRGYALKISPDTKGKVIIGNSTILFQLIPPGPAKPVLKLPRELRGGFIRSIDLHFVLILILSMLLHLATIRLFNSIPMEEEIPVQIEDNRFTKLVTEDDIIIPEDEPIPEDADLEEAKKKPGKGPGKGKEGPKGPETKGILALIVKQGKERGAVADILSEGLGDDLVSALASVGGVQVAKSGDVGKWTRGGGGGGGAVDIDNLGSYGAKGSRDIEDKRIRRVKSAISTGESDVQGKLDSRIIAQTVRKYLGGIKACYEYQLKRNPNLRGKVTVRFTIGVDGQVKSVVIVSSSLQDELVKNCILRRIKRWRFPAPEEGTVTVSYPFIFTTVSGG